MNRRPLRTSLLSSVALLAAGFSLHAWAQASASHQITRQSIDAGGGRSTSARFDLVSISGQPDAAAPMSSSYALRGGLLRAAEVATSDDPIFANGFEP